MRSFQRITVGLSSTASDVEVLNYAALVARLGVTREFQFVHLIARGRRIDLEWSRNDALARIESLVEANFDVAGDDLLSSFHIVEGARADGLAAFVSEHESELILLGNRQRRPVRHSLAHRLAATSLCSIWTVPRRSGAKLTRILAPVDFSEHSADGLSQAAAIACLYGLDECLALHVSSTCSMDGVAERSDLDLSRQHRRFAEFLKPVNSHGVTIVPHVVESPQIAPAILRCAKRVSADLIVISTRGEGSGDSTDLGRVTSQALLESDMPVLAVRHYADSWTAQEARRDLDNLTA